MHMYEESCDNRSSVSVIIACRNEALHIRRCIESLIDDFTQQECEFVIADGMSNDNTVRIIRELQRRYHNIRLVHNLGIIQAHGLNLAIDQSVGEIIVRADAHSAYPPRYVQTCVARCRSTGSANVGGVMDPVGTASKFQEAVCVAMKHRAGVGNNHFHLGGYSGEVDTVYLGTFRKEMLLRVGKYDPKSHPAEDVDLNHRIRLGGGVVLLDSSIKVSYVPRHSFGSLARQFAGYARGRAYMAHKHPQALSFRHLLAPLLFVAICVSTIASIRFPVAAALPLAYLAVLCCMSTLAREASLGARVLLPLVFATMHMSWGYGFLRRTAELLFGHLVVHIRAPAVGTRSEQPG